jgi:Tfp pilus assembly protein PilV
MRGRTRHSQGGAYVSARRGMVMLDVIVGGVILGIGIAVIMSLASRSLSAQTEGERRMQAAWLADELLNMVLVEGPKDYEKLYSTHGDFDVPFENFAYEVEIDDLDRGLLYDVTATVAWGDMESQRQRVVVQAYIAQRQYGDLEGAALEIVEERKPLSPLDRDERWYGEDETIAPTGDDGGEGR